MGFETDGDPRPAVWVGHVVMGVTDVKRCKTFFLELGLRDVEPDAEVAILELRGGTHLILLPTPNETPAETPAPFDLMVDDVDAAHRHCEANGLEPGEIQTESFHRAFRLTVPSGHLLTINSTHVSGLPV